MLLGVGLKSQLRKRIAQGAGQFSFRKVYTGEIRELLAESILIRAIVKIPRDIRKQNATKRNMKKSN